MKAMHMRLKTAILAGGFLGVSALAWAQGTPDTERERLRAEVRQAVVHAHGASQPRHQLSRDQRAQLRDQLRAGAAQRPVATH